MSDQPLSAEDAREFGRLADEAFTLGRQVDIFLGVYIGESNIKTKAQAVVAMARLDEIAREVQVLRSKYGVTR